MPCLPFHEPGDKDASFVKQIHWPGHEDHRYHVRGRSDDGSEEENDHDRKCTSLLEHFVAPDLQLHEQQHGQRQLKGEAEGYDKLRGE